MILAVLGTHGHHFPRAVRRAAEVAAAYDDALVVQRGHTAPVADVDARWVTWCSRGDLDGLMHQARIVVVHGGSGCIFQALGNGAIPVVIPRLARFGEHVDDHQLQLGGRLEGTGQVILWRHEDSVAAVLARWARACELADRRETRTTADLGPALWAAAAALSRRAGSRSWPGLR